MTIDQFATYVGYIVMVASATLFVVGLLAFAAAIINDWMKDIHRAAMNT